MKKSKFEKTRMDYLKSTVKDRLDAVCNDYLKIFIDKNDYEVPEIYCVGNDPLGVWCINDDWFNFSEIKTDIDNNAATGKLLEFMQYEQEIRDENDLNKDNPKYAVNYANFLNNAHLINPIILAAEKKAAEIAYDKQYKEEVKKFKNYIKRNC